MRGRGWVPAKATLTESDSGKLRGRARERTMGCVRDTLKARTWDYTRARETVQVWESGTESAWDAWAPALVQAWERTWYHHTSCQFERRDRDKFGKGTM